MNEIIKELEQLTQVGKWKEAKAKIEDVKKSDLSLADKVKIYFKFAVMQTQRLFRKLSRGKQHETKRENDE